MPANLHHIFDHALDGLNFSLFSLKTFAKRVDYGFSECFSYQASLANEPILILAAVLAKVNIVSASYTRA